MAASLVPLLFPQMAGNWLRLGLGICCAWKVGCSRTTAFKACDFSGVVPLQRELQYIVYMYTLLQRHDNDDDHKY